MRNTMWALGLGAVVAAATGCGHGLAFFVLLLAVEVDLYSLKGPLSEEERLPLDGSLEGILLGCTLLVVALCSAIYIRAWRQDVRRRRKVGGTPPDR